VLHQKVPIFNYKSANMKRYNLTALVLMISVLFAFTACEKDSEKGKRNTYSKTGIALTGAQETPANASTATGSMDISFFKGSNVLTYKVTWTGLTGPPTAMHVHGLAPTGFPAGIVQTILSASNPTAFPASGSYTGSMTVDNITVKEQDLLNGLYYMNIHTSTYPAGEIRGQIKFD
jgi:hypothetical protein